MRKVTKLLFSAIVALGVSFTACNNNDLPDGPDVDAKANTHVSVTLKLATGTGTPTKALPNDYNYVGEWGGKDKITEVAVYISDNVTVKATNFTVGAVGDGKDYEVTSNGILKPTSTAAIKTTVGLKKVYVLVNGTADAKALLNVTQAAAFETAYASVMTLANSDAFVQPVSTSASKIAAKNGSADETIMMTVIEPGTINVAPNVTETQTIDNAQNRVSLDVDRTVARVMVTTAKDSYDVPSVDGSSVIGSLTNVSWILAQGENSLYVQRKSNWNTPNHAWVPSGNTDYWTNAGDKYDYSGLYEDYTVATQFGGTAVPTMATYTNTIPGLTPELESLRGKFVLATTHEYGVKDASKYKKGNTAYVLVRAKFTPAEFADGTTYTAGDDFYLGANGKFFGVAANAVDPAKGGVVGQTAAKYVGGKVLYYAWVNPDELPEWYNSPVLRNNIYHIHITGFKTIGTNWNPLFPEDPDNPTLVPNPEDPDGPKIPSNPDPKPGKENPTDPEEPTNPIDPEDPLTTPETYMSVDVKVLPWKVHSYQVDLGI